MLFRYRVGILLFFNFGVLLSDRLWWARVRQRVLRCGRSVLPGWSVGKLLSISNPRVLRERLWWARDRQRVLRCGRIMLRGWIGFILLPGYWGMLPGWIGQRLRVNGG